jgi:formylmethanofuran dehydrogenase subunit E
VNDSSSEQLSQVITFHGHLCPGLLIGYRAAQIALRELGVARAQDEELVAICENDACGVDAIQVLTGCTLGKGNLILRDWGKQVFIFGHRHATRGKLLRVALRYGVIPAMPEKTPEERRQAAIELLKTAPENRLYAIRWIDSLLPAPARILRTRLCSRCGEGVMESRVRLWDDELVCPECYEEIRPCSG